jgi:hypothetical protein
VVRTSKIISALAPAVTDRVMGAAMCPFLLHLLLTARRPPRHSTWIPSGFRRFQHPSDVQVNAKPTRRANSTATAAPELA